ncbi:hypothetical protein EDC18_102252 [Natranaerovirga pectinivora]|uniref:Uncharacterized protein n=1 Tax=Natranaerovirga pectinivora TaxID=682400 RepID=A0A4R3MMP5_9FIRM|nr:hypothetical protein [Natranaerovirga pectinivora]TCT16235.1 hypothetical protein EDC18_102252 [Natranaerovirga pectinivora]
MFNLWLLAPIGILILIVMIAFWEKALPKLIKALYFIVPSVLIISTVLVVKWDDIQYKREYKETYFIPLELYNWLGNIELQEYHIEVMSNDSKLKDIEILDFKYNQLGDKWNAFTFNIRYSNKTYKNIHNHFNYFASEFSDDKGNTYYTSSSPFPYEGVFENFEVKSHTNVDIDIEKLKEFTITIYPLDNKNSSELGEAMSQTFIVKEVKKVERVKSYY